MALVASIVRVQRLVRRILTERIAVEKIVLNQISVDTSLTSALIVENLLTGEFKTGEVCLGRMVNRVSGALNEAHSSSNQVFPAFIHQDPLVIPLPHSSRKLEFPTSFRSKAINARTHVECNRLNLNSKANDPGLAQSLPYIPRSLENEKVATPDNIRKNHLAKQATELMREARKALHKSRKSSFQHVGRNLLPNRRKTSTIRSLKKCNVDKSDTIENFGGAATMPSPIKEENTDWDWISDW